MGSVRSEDRRTCRAWRARWAAHQAAASSVDQGGSQRQRPRACCNVCASVGRSARAFAKHWRIASSRPTGNGPGASADGGSGRVWRWWESTSTTLSAGNTGFPVSRKYPTGLEGGGELAKPRRRRDLLVAGPHETATHAARRLQPRHVGVAIQPVEAAHFQGDVVFENLGDVGHGTSSGSHPEEISPNGRPRRVRSLGRSLSRNPTPRSGPPRRGIKQSDLTKLRPVCRQR